VHKKKNRKIKLQFLLKFVVFYFPVRSGLSFCDFFFTAFHGKEVFELFLSLSNLHKF